MAVFIQNAFHGWDGLGLVVNSGAPATVLTTSNDPRISAAGRAGATMTTVSQPTQSSTPATDSSGKLFRTAEAAQAAQAAYDSQRSMSITPWLAELSATTKDSIGLVQLAETQWSDVQGASTVEKFQAFSKWVGTARNRADGNAQKAQQLRDSITSMAGSDGKFAPQLQQARDLTSRSTAIAGRLAELERFSAQAATQLGITGQSTGAQTGSGFNIPTWGYVVGGAAVIGLAWYFGRK